MIFPKWYEIHIALFNNPNPYNLALFKIPAHYLFPIEYVVRMMKEYRAQGIIPVLAHQIGALPSPITIQVLFLFNNLCYPQTN